MRILIVGLTKSDSGRSCDEHAVCGSSVEVGDVVFFEPIKSGKEYMVHRGPCTVGYLKLTVARAHPPYHFSERLAEVRELYTDRKKASSVQRRMSYAFNGVARVELYPKCFTKTLK